MVPWKRGCDCFIKQMPKSDLDSDTSNYYQCCINGLNKNGEAVRYNIESTIKGVPDVSVCWKHAHCHHCDRHASVYELFLLSIWHDFGDVRVGLKCRRCKNLKRFIIAMSLGSTAALTGILAAHVAAAVAASTGAVGTVNTNHALETVHQLHTIHHGLECTAELLH